MILDYLGESLGVFPSTLSSECSFNGSAFSRTKVKFLPFPVEAVTVLTFRIVQSSLFGRRSSYSRLCAITQLADNRSKKAIEVSANLHNKVTKRE